MVVLQLHILYLSNGNCLSQKEQIKLVGAELLGGVVGGVDLLAFSLVNKVSFSSGWFEVFINGVDDVLLVLHQSIYFGISIILKKPKKLQ